MAVTAFSLAATVTSAAEPIGSSLGQVFEMTKAMATAPRLYSSASGEQNPGKYPSRTKAATKSLIATVITRKAVIYCIGIFETNLLLCLRVHAWVI